MRWLLGVVACLCLAVPARADITVTMSGNAAADTLSISANDAQNQISIREGFEGDVGPGGGTDTCGGGDTLCFLTVEATEPVRFNGACERVTETKVRCAYFHVGTASATHTYTGRIDLRGGTNDRVSIVQGQVGEPAGEASTPWQWDIDYGAGNDIIDGPVVLSVPDERADVPIRILGGRGSDLFKGLFPRRPFTLLGDDGDDTASFDGTDIFDKVEGGFGLTLRGEGNDDQFAAGLTRAGYDAGPGNDSISLSGAIDADAERYDGGSGVDSISYGSSPPGMRIILDGSETSTGNDTLVGIENARGGPRPDRIVGTDAANELIGAGGAGDNLTGRGGNDVLDVDDQTAPPAGTTSDDTVDAGAGEDTVRSNDGVRDLIACGTSSSEQTVVVNNVPRQFSFADQDHAFVDLTDQVRDCEDVERQAVRTPPAAAIVRVRRAGDELRLRLRCGRGVRGECRGRGRVRGGKAVAYRISAGRPGRLVLPLPGRVRRTARIELVERDAQGRERTRRTTVQFPLRRA